MRSRESIGESSTAIGDGSAKVRYCIPMTLDGNLGRKPTPTETVGELKAIQAQREAAADAHDGISKALTDMAKILKVDLENSPASLFDQKLLAFCIDNAADFQLRAGRESTVSPAQIKDEVTELLFGGTALNPNGWFGRNKDLADPDLYGRRVVDMRAALEKRLGNTNEA